MIAGESDGWLIDATGLRLHAMRDTLSARNRCQPLPNRRQASPRRPRLDRGGGDGFGPEILAYWLTGSVALYSDALESIVNLVTAVAALYAVHIANQPADRQHQFGHHKAEYFSAVLEGVLIVIAALLILPRGLRCLLAPRTLNRSGSGLASTGWPPSSTRAGRIS